MSGIIDDKLNETLRLEFVEGYEDNAGVRVYPTLDALIKRHDVPKNTVYRRAKDQSWQEQRNQWQATYQAKVNKDRATKAAKDADAMDSASINIAKASLSVVMRRVNATFRAERGDEGSNAADIVSVTELRDLVETGLKAQKMGKLALGEASEISKVTTDEFIPPSLARIIDRLDGAAEAKSQGAGNFIQ